LPGVKILKSGGVGIEVDGVRIWFDSPRYGEARFISHAHLDHISGIRRAYATPETISILEAIGRRGEWKRIYYRLKLDLGNSVRISALPSGHVLGSSQFLVETEEGRVIYTGDLNVYDSIILRGGEPVEAEKLVIEATYGSPFYVFPSRERIYAEIVRWILRTVKEGSIPAFRVYALGKSQEIIKIVNTYLGLPVVVSWAVARISEKHLEHGIKLDYLPANDTEGLEVLRQGECIYVSSERTSLPTGKRVKWAMATGWALRFRYPSYDAAFPLSGHSDYPGLLKYVEESKPKEVHVIHGYVEEFSRQLKRRGFNAKPLREPQTTLNL